MIRLEVRCPPPPHATGPRSGSFVLDLHDLKLSPGASSSPRKQAARFAENAFVEEPVRSRASEVEANTLLSLDLKRVVLSYAPAGESRAHAIASMGPFDASKAPDLTGSNFGASPSSLETVSLVPTSIISVVISQSLRARSPANASASSGTVIGVDIPSVHVNLDKPILDGLQFWADDISQLLDRTLGEQLDSEKNSRSASIVGSNFFVKSRSGSESELDSASISGRASETILKVTMTEGA